MEKAGALYAQYAAPPPLGLHALWGLTDTDTCQSIPGREATVQISPLNAES